jgi:predicted metal-binding membrane protein
MMLPSLVPMLGRYRRAVATTSETHLALLTALVGVGYFFVWTVVGVAVFPLGVALAAIEMQQLALARAVPNAIGVVVVIAGALQLTAWKARRLACCREAPGCGHTLPADAATAWRHGLHLGLHCAYCCANLMAILLVIGVMDLGVMALVTAAITLERLAPVGELVARAIGVVVVGAGLFLLLPQSGELDCHQLVVSHLSVESADLAGEPGDMGDHLLSNGRVVEGSVARHFVRDEACLLGGK